MVTIRIPAPSSVLLTNLLGVLGVLSIVIAVAALTSWQWGLLTFGLFALTLVVAAQTAARATAAGTVTELDTHRQRVGKAA